MIHHVDSLRHGNQVTQLWDDYCAAVRQVDALQRELDALRREVSDLRRAVVDHETEDAG